jgi:agmatine/peptidylarginine deiminase
VYDEVRRRAELKGLDEFGLFRAATPPVKLARVLPEWERARYLILALPEVVSLDPRNGPAFEATFLNVIREAVEVTDVLVLLDSARPRYLRRFVRLLGEQGLGDRLAPAFEPAGRADGPPRVHIVPVATDSYWVRDFGPLFATAEDGRLCVLDTMYRDIRGEERRREQVSLIALGGISLGGANPGIRNDDDRVPTLLAPTLSSRLVREPVRVIRPPLQLWGGDFYTDGAGTGFTSTNTLEMNGGDEVWVNRLFREYFGVKRMVYLEPLPGNTIKHVDMFFRPAGPKTFLLADYPADVPASSPYYDHLHRETRAVLDRNAEILRAAYPGAQLIRVPMPPLEFKADRLDMRRASIQYLQKARVSLDDFDSDDEFIEAALRRAIANGKGDAARPQATAMLRLVADWREEVAPRKEDEFELGQQLTLVRENIRQLEVLTELRRDGSVSSADAVRLRILRADQKALEQKLDALRADGVFESRALYHTYLNAVHLRGATAEKVLVPAYYQYRKMEPAVREQFQRAYPNADVAFVNADLLVRQLGALHCMTCVVPDHRPAGPK